MLHDFLENKIISFLPFVPTQEQSVCIKKLSVFLEKQKPNQLFLLKGYAGTGKTSVIGALVKAMSNLEQNTVLLAPTGRAAKVFSLYSGRPATSIHKRIYRQKSADDFRFTLNINKSNDTLFIIDEVSMLTNSQSEGTVFGSGHLLDDLIEYVYSARNCKMIFLGDTAQLLPVKQNFSPALDKTLLERFSLEVEEFTLTEVVRQTADSGILANATMLRKAMDKIVFEYPKINLDFSDIKRITGAELIDNICASYGEVGEINTIVVTRSNKNAAEFNNGIRNQVLHREEELSNGDLLMVVKNNYFWSEQYDSLNFIANGDIAEVLRIRGYNDIYGCRFANATLKLLDYDMEIDCKILLDSFITKTPSENDLLGKRLFEEVEKDYMHIANRRKRYQEMRRNEYLNALQTKFSYAVTCHKSQGGQWQHVYVYHGFLTEDNLNTEFLQWLYTAMTRAQTKLFLVNFNKNFF